MRDLYKFICTHSLAVVCGETSDRNPNEPKLQAVKITDGKRSDTMSAALTESEIRKVVDFLADCTYKDPRRSGGGSRYSSYLWNENFAAKHDRL